MKIPRPAHDTFTFTSLEHKKKVFKANFGDGAPIVTDGYGGWEISGRPKNIGLTEWKGRNPIAIEIPFVIDHYSFGASKLREPADWGRFDRDSDKDPEDLWRVTATEDMVGKLSEFCGLGDSDAPPILEVDGGGVIPHDKTNADGADHQWVIESVTWDRDLEIRSSLHQGRMRCGGMIVIRQFKTSSDILRRIGSRSRARKPEIYIVKKGDTLHKIAAKKYKNANKWKLIADANNLRDPRSLTVGRQIRIPR